MNSNDKHENEEKEIIEEDITVEEEYENDNEKTNKIEFTEDEFKIKISSLEEENLSLNASLARLQADFINYKNRTEKEKSTSIKLANEDLIMKLLPVIDDLERAYNHFPESSEYSEGIKIIINNFKEILKREGLEEIESNGNQFDHNFHQAILMEQNEDVKSGNIIETFQKGYILNGKVIRPSMVKVSE